MPSGLNILLIPNAKPADILRIQPFMDVPAKNNPISMKKPIHAD